MLEGVLEAERQEGFQQGKEAGREEERI